jgi:hypothetical protein
MTRHEAELRLKCAGAVITVGAQVPHETFAMVLDQAVQQECTSSEIVRRALAEYLAPRGAA